MAIDIGPGATDRSSSVGSGSTRIDMGNPSNGRGYLNVIEVQAVDTGVTAVIATFYGSGTSWNSRDSHNLGLFYGFVKTTFTGLDIDVEVGDCLGIYWSGGDLESATSGGLGYYSKSGNQIGGGTQEYSLTDNDGIISIYGTGVDVGPVGVKTINGLAMGSVKTINGLVIGSVKILNGLA